MNEQQPTHKQQFEAWLLRQGTDPAQLSHDDKKRLYAQFKRDQELDKTREQFHSAQQRYSAACQGRCDSAEASLLENAASKDPELDGVFYSILLSHLRLTTPH